MSLISRRAGQVCIRVISSVLLISVQASAQSLLVRSEAPAWPGYGNSNFGLFASLLDTRFSGGVTVETNVSALNHLLTFDAIMLNTGSSLSPTEISNLQQYAATGRRMVLFGESCCQPVGGNWNQDIASVVGGTYLGATPVGYANVVYQHAITQGLSSIYHYYGGQMSGAAASGGVDLTNLPGFLSLWGANQNVLTFLDIDAPHDNNYYTEATLLTNTADWLDESSAIAPEPSSIILLTTGLLAVFGVARRRRSQA